MVVLGARSHARADTRPCCAGSDDTRAAGSGAAYALRTRADANLPKRPTAQEHGSCSTTLPVPFQHISTALQLLPTTHRRPRAVHACTRAHRTPAYHRPAATSHRPSTRPLHATRAHMHMHMHPPTLAAHRASRMRKQGTTSCSVHSACAYRCGHNARDRAPRTTYRLRHAVKSCVVKT